MFSDPHLHLSAREPPLLFALPFSGSTKVRSFLLCQAPPSILHPTSRQGGQRYEVFDIHKYRLAPPPPCHFSKIKSDLQIKLTPLLSVSPPASPFSGSTKVRSFSLCQAPPLFFTPHLDREGKGTKFLTFTSTALPRHRLAISQRSCQISQPVLPHYHPPRLLPLPFSGSTKVRSFLLCQAPLYSPPHISTGSTKVRSFSLCQALSPRTPSLLPSLRGATKLRTFWHLQASPLSKTHSPLKGSAKVRSFSLCQAPLLFRLAFS